MAPLPNPKFRKQSDQSYLQGQRVGTLDLPNSYQTT